MKWLLNNAVALIFAMVSISLQAGAALVLPVEETAVLSTFLRVLFEHSQVGYVVFNQKPVCIHGYLERDLSCLNFPLNREEVALKEGIRIWKNYENKFEKSKVCIHICKRGDPGIRGYRHLLIINKPMFHAVVNENLPLFQKVLGPSVTSQMLYDALTIEDCPFHFLLKYDSTLAGILLGYGTQNSLYASHLEEIQNAMLKTVPPFLHGSSFTRMHIEEFFPFPPSIGYQNLEQEFRKLDGEMDVSSEKLLEENPPFIFGCLRDQKGELGGKDCLISRFEKTQDVIQEQLKSPLFLEQSLEMITGEKFTSSISKGFQFLIDHEKKVEILAAGIWMSIRSYDPCYYFPFIKGLDGAPSSGTIINQEACNPNYPVEMRRATENLLNAEDFFKKVDRKNKFKCVVPKKLYFAIKEQGDGSTNTGGLAKFTYSVFSPIGHCLASESEALVNLKNTIPGFFLGVRGMRVGETRELLIHPALAYGYETSLEKAIYLRVVVTLVDSYDIGNIEIDQSYDEIDLKFLLDPNLNNIVAENCAVAGLENGRRLREILRQDSTVDISKISEQLRKYAEGKETYSDLTEQREMLNKILWNLYFAGLTRKVIDGSSVLHK